MPRNTNKFELDVPTPPPKRGQPDWPPALILGAFQTGVVNARNLRRRGIRTALADCDPTQTGFHSWSARAMLCPDPDTAPEAWAEWMCKFAAGSKSKPVLLASADVFVTAIARFESVLREHFLVSLGCRLAGELADKDTQYRLAFEHGMPMPITSIVDSVDGVRRFVDEASFPIVLKPLHFREWQRFPKGHPLSYQKVLVAHDSRELIAGFELAAPAGARVVLQEIIQGLDTNKRVYMAHYSSTGERTGFAVFRELRSNPVAFGVPTVNESYPEPEAAAVCDDFLRAIGFRGICEIEVKRDSRSGRFLLIEANPRLSGSGDGGNYVGVDLAWLHYLDLIGIRYSPVVQGSRSIRHIMVRPEGGAAAHYVKAGALRWTDILASYRPPVAFFDLDFASPILSMKNLFRAITDAVRVSRSPLDPATIRNLEDAGAVPPTDMK